MLINAVQSVEEWQTKTAAQIHAELTNPTIPKRRDELLSWQGIGTYLGHAIAANIQYELEKAISQLDPDSQDPHVRQLARMLRYVKSSLDGGRLNFALDETQYMLESQRAYFVSLGMPVDGMKAIGRWVEALWQQPQFGLEAEPTLQEVAKCLDSLKVEAERQEALQEGAETWNQFVAAMEAYDGTGTKPRLVLFDGVP